MEQNQSLSELISKIYQTSTDVAKLQQVMDCITEDIGADLGTIAFGESKSEKVNHIVVTRQAIDTEPAVDYASCFRPWIHHVLKMDAERLHRHPDMASSRAMLNGNSANGLDKNFDFDGGVSTYFELNEAHYGYLSFCKSNGRPGFDDKDLAKLELLVPHIKQAFEINDYLSELTVLHDVTQDRYQQLSIGVVLLDEEGQIVFSNPIAKRLLKDPGGIGISQGKLRSASNEETAKLSQLIKSCVQTANIKGAAIKGAANDGFLSISREHLNKPPLSVSITSYANKPDARTVSAKAGRALAIIFDPDRRQITQEYILERLYNLTNAEASLATHLAGGKTLNELAADHEISRETLRSQLKRVFQKTHTNRQSELVKLVLSGPGSLMI